MEQEVKKRGRKTMTEEEKAAAAKFRAEKKAKEDNLRPAVIIQYQAIEANTADLIEQAMAAFKAEKKRTPHYGYAALCQAGGTCRLLRYQRDLHRKS